MKDRFLTFNNFNEWNTRLSSDPKETLTGEAVVWRGRRKEHTEDECLHKRTMNYGSSAVPRPSTYCERAQDLAVR